MATQETHMALPEYMPFTGQVSRLLTFPATTEVQSWSDAQHLHVWLVPFFCFTKNGYQKHPVDLIEDVSAFKSKH